MSLPSGWSVCRDSNGRVYYANHETKTTTWERPAGLTAGSHGATQPGVYKPDIAFSPRVAFWTAAGLGWFVWIFAVASAADDQWLEMKHFWYMSEYTDNTRFAAGSDAWFDICDDRKFAGQENNAQAKMDSFCEVYSAFTAMQFIATILCSAAVVVLSVAFIRPEKAARASVGNLALVGAALMGLYALFQFIAFVLAAVLADEPIFNYMGVTAHEGDTFGVGVAGFVFGVADTVALAFFKRHGGDGPLNCRPPPYLPPPPGHAPRPTGPTVADGNAEAPTPSAAAEPWTVLPPLSDFAEDDSVPAASVVSAASFSRVAEARTQSEPSLP